MIKSYISTQLLTFFMKQNNMYVTTSRCDDYPTSMNSQETIKKVQSGPYQIFVGTNCSSGLLNTFTYKNVSKIIAQIQKCQDKKVVFRLKYISIQGSYTELMLEQIMNSQEDNQTDRNMQVKFKIPVYKNYNSNMQITHICAM